MLNIYITLENISSEKKDDLSTTLRAFLNKKIVDFDFVSDTYIVFSNITESGFKCEVINKKNQLLANKMSNAIKVNSIEIKSIFSKHI